MVKAVDEAIEFALVMASEAPGSVKAHEVCELLRLARQYGKLMEDLCNYDMGERGEKRRERLEGRIGGIVKLWGYVPVFSGDPRGATVKIRVPSGRSDSWGGEGICVPGR